MSENTWRPSEPQIRVLNVLLAWEATQYPYSLVRGTKPTDSDVLDSTGQALSLVPGFVVRATKLALSVEPCNPDDELPNLASHGCVQAADSRPWPLPFLLRWGIGGSRVIQIAGRIFDHDWTGIELKASLDGKLLFSDEQAVAWHDDDFWECKAFAWSLLDKGRAVILIPPFDAESGQWVKAAKAAELKGVTVATLKTYRGWPAWTSPDKMSGIDLYGRKWRRPKPSDKSHPWYYVPSLKPRKPNRAPDSAKSWINTPKP